MLIFSFSPLFKCTTFVVLSDITAEDALPGGVCLRLTLGFGLPASRCGLVVNCCVSLLLWVSPISEGISKMLLGITPVCRQVLSKAWSRDGATENATTFYPPVLETTSVVA
ncbi:hypothetical protein FKM82_006452 [Ascaphus truei]